MTRQLRTCFVNITGLLVWSAAISGMLMLCSGSAAAQNLWDLFSNTYKTNVLAWSRYNGNPVVGATGSTWKNDGIGGPELLSYRSRTLMFFRGSGAYRTAPGILDRIGVSEITDYGAGRLSHREINDGLPVVDVGAAGSFDRYGVSDPGAVMFKGQIYLYYTGRSDSSCSIGLAVSADGEQFVKVGRVLPNAMCPDVVAIGDTLYMVFQRMDSIGYTVHAAFSTDGRRFYELGNRPVFDGRAGDWDARSITTPRIWKQGGLVYMLYGGSAGDVDEPEFFGLARSRDMVHWERHPGNPVFGAGIHGGPDGGTIRTPALFEIDTWFIMIYEGRLGHRFWADQSSICMAWVLKK
jgi:predicted GH43/DUF377 family glycosyl hydrolase